MSYVLGAFAAKKEEEKERRALRDYFAAKAMQGLIACGGVSDTTAKWIAEIAYCYADAMLAEREK